MRFSRLWTIRICLLFLLLPVNVCSAAQTRPEGNEPLVTTIMTQEELQAAVISYANRFIATVGQAAFRFEEKLPTPEARLIAAARKVYSLSAVTEIAAGPQPGAAMLDLVVTATLNRMVWEDYWRPQVFGMPATIIVDAFNKMEKEAWRMASQVMTPQQLEELKDLILDWKAANPDQVAVDFIRFSDFGDLGKKPNLKEIQKPGGVLAPIREATQAADEVRRTSERAMFLLSKMQLIAGFQVELVYKQLVMQPEVVKALEDVTKFRETSERFASLLEKLPKDVAGEREAVMKAFDVRESKIRGIIEEVHATLDRADGSFANLQKTSADAERLLAGTEKTGRVFQDLVQSADRLATKFESNRPFDIKDYTAVLTQLQDTVQQLNDLVVTVDRTSSPLITNILDQFNASAEKRVDHAFRRLVQLFSIIAAMVIIIVVVHNLLRRREVRRSKT
jgi:cytochrome c556